LHDGTDGVFDRVEYEYNRLGEVTELTDQNGTVHQFGYDSGADYFLGRISYLADDNGSVSPGTHLAEYTRLGNVTLGGPSPSSEGGLPALLQVLLESPHEAQQVGVEFEADSP
jgi:hypothetical protein